MTAKSAENSCIAGKMIRYSVLSTATTDREEIQMVTQQIDFENEDINREYDIALRDIAARLEKFNEFLDSSRYPEEKRVQAVGVFFSPLNESDGEFVDLIGVPDPDEAVEPTTSTAADPLVGWECDGKTGNRCYFYWRRGRLVKRKCKRDPACPTT